jgi:hypothetical protein
MAIVFIPNSPSPPNGTISSVPGDTGGVSD